MREGGREGGREGERGLGKREGGRGWKRGGGGSQMRQYVPLPELAFNFPML